MYIVQSLIGIQQVKKLLCTSVYYFTETSSLK